MGKVLKGMPGRQTGFTLIEIVMVLVLLGILAAVAVPKYFDMKTEASDIAAQATFQEIQARIYSKFSEKILLGASCSEAREYVGNLENLSDRKDGGIYFGEFFVNQSSISDAGENGKAVALSNAEGELMAEGVLFLPTCHISSPVVPESSETTVAFALVVAQYAFYLEPVSQKALSMGLNEQWNSLDSASEASEAVNNFLRQFNYRYIPDWAITKKEAGYEVLIMDGENSGFGCVVSMDSSFKVLDGGRSVQVSLDGGKYKY